MPKFTRCKRNKKNKTLKIGGSEERKGVIDIISDKLGDAASVVIDKTQDIGLNVLGLEKIDKSNETTIIDENIAAASGVVGNVTTGVINNVNEVLDSPVVNQGVKEAGKETAAIVSKLAETFNDAMDNQIVKENVENAIEHAGEIGAVVVKASEEPLKEVARVSTEAGSKALGAASAGFIKVGTDILAAVPGVGGIIEIGKMINDGSKAASAVIEAGTEAVETASDAFIETTENVKKGLKELEEKKKMVEQISNRTAKSITQFENPLSATKQIGGYKSRRRLFKRKPKTKRVRFAI